MTDTDLPVLAAHTWPTNAHLIADMARLGHLNDTDTILDPTFHRGKWWTLWTPTAGRLVASTNRGVPADGDRLADEMHYGVDFRDLPFGDAIFDAVTYDPPYVAPGGRAKSTIGEFNDRYGLHDTPKRPDSLQDHINAGLAEMARVVKPGGTVLVKCQDYVNAGRLWPGTFLTTVAADGLGLRLKDRIEHVAKAPRPQPTGRTRKGRLLPDGTHERIPTMQHHARRNLSTLLVFTKPRRKSTTAVKER